jgi:hypothetical protein
MFHKKRTGFISEINRTTGDTIITWCQNTKASVKTWHNLISKLHRWNKTSWYSADILNHPHIHYQASRSTVLVLSLGFSYLFVDITNVSHFKTENKLHIQQSVVQIKESSLITNITDGRNIQRIGCNRNMKKII